jgi:hypothetical protein
MASIILPILISLILGGGMYFLINSLPLDNLVKMTVALIVVIASYTILAEVFQTRYTY